MDVNKTRKVPPRIKAKWSTSIGEEGNEIARGKKTDYNASKSAHSPSDFIRIELQFTVGLARSILRSYMPNGSNTLAT